MRVSLTTGAYQAKSIIANAQRCCNLYPETNPADAESPTTHYQTPGLLTKVTSTQNSWRGLWRAANGNQYGVCGNQLYQIRSDWSLNPLGTLGTSNGPVSMCDNGIQMLVVDGTTTGYYVEIDGNVFHTLIDDAFYGSNRVDLCDGYFILNRPGTNQFYISGFLSVTFDPLDFAAKTGYSDKLATIAVAKRYIFLLGEQTTEVWYNTGAQDFTFGRMPGVFIQHGCIAKASVAQMDGTVFWLSQDPQGRAIAMRTAQFEGQRFSTHAIENAIQGYSRVDDAIGFCYQQEGHYFYVLQFPTASKTWVFDLATEQWHERMWHDTDGREYRHRSNCCAVINGTTAVGDWQNGKLYDMSLSYFDDDGVQIERIRSFPHLVDGLKRVMYRQFIADMQVGDTTAATGPEVRLRWSDTRGRSWGNYITGSLGAIGEFLTCIQFQRLGMARDRVFELSWSDPQDTALNGAYIDMKTAKT